MVRLTRIYTKTGDDGTTALGDNSRTSKNDPRLEAFATVDESNSNIGVVMAMSKNTEPEIYNILLQIQNDLFDVGADLCTPVVDSPEYPPLRVIEEQIVWLESQIDVYNEQLSNLESFILPSGTYISAQLHVARTVVRRAERETWRAIHQFGSGVNPLTAKYLNRLSDLLFVLARWSNQEIGDVLWAPGKNRAVNSSS